MQENPPSRVIFIDNLADSVVEDDVITLLQDFGSVDRVILLRRKQTPILNPSSSTDHENDGGSDKRTQQALVQMSSIENAIAAVNSFTNEPREIQGLKIGIAFSKNQELNNKEPSPQKKAQSKEKQANRILLITIQNALYPITTDIIQNIFSAYGALEKVVIFMKPVGLQCLVQFTETRDAIKAKKNLDNESIYPNCCIMLIYFSNLKDLIVKENSLRMKDYLNPDLPTPTNDTPVNSAASPMQLSLPLAPPNTSSSIDHNGNSAPSPLRIVNDPLNSASPVVLVCNLKETISCDKLFNLFSCYGNITKIKKFHSKPDHALVQFVSETVANIALVSLRGFVLEGKSLEIRFSNHKYISSRSNIGHQNEEGDEELTKEYPNSLNRFTGKYANHTKHIYSPTKVLHFSNITNECTEEDMKDHLSEYIEVEKVKLKLFANAKGHPQVLAEFYGIEAATNVLAAAHNSILHDRKLKIAFSRINT